jgi:small subunit ribosomal protein S16
LSTKIRLRRVGKKKQPFYRIVVADSRKARDSRAIEEIGTYNPITRPGRITVQEERIYEWLGLGAELSDTVNSLFRRIGLMQKWSLMKAGQDVSDMEIKTELVETTKPTHRGKKAKAAEAEAAAAKTEAPAAEAKPAAAKAEAPAAETKPVAAKTEAPAAEEAPAEEVQAKAAPAEEPAVEEKTEESNN